MEAQNQPAQYARAQLIKELCGVTVDNLNFSADSAIVPQDEVTQSPVRTVGVAESWNTSFLSKINIERVDNDTGSILDIGTSGPLAGTTDNSVRRQPINPVDINTSGYRCQQANCDTVITYDELDKFGSVEGYAKSIRMATDRRRCLDRLLIGFNGTHYASVSDPGTYPNRDDCGVGWLEKYRKDASDRVIAGLSVSSNDKAGTHGTIDSLVLDGWGASIDERWHHDLVAVCNHRLLHRKYFPLISTLDSSRMNSELLVNNELIKNPELGNLPAVAVPFFPENAVLVISLKNLSYYWQNGSYRILVKDEPQYNRLAFYESWKEDYVVERYESGCLIDNITFL